LSFNRVSSSGTGTTAGAAQDTFQLEPLRDLGVLEDEWAALAERTANVFSTPDWASVWWRHFGGGRELLPTACRDAEGRLVAMLPLYLWSRRPVRVARFIGHGPADQLGPVCDPSNLAAVGAAVRNGLERGTWDCDLLIGDRLPGVTDWQSLLDGKLIERESSPVMHAGMSWDELLKSRSSNFREQVRRRERKLAREHDLSYRLADPHTLDADFDTLVRLHEGRWAEASDTFATELKAFHLDFARRALERGWLRLWVLEADGEPVAAWHGFRIGGVESYYQSGRDRAWDRYRVGFVLLTHTMREAFDDGMREYRLLRGAEQYKDRFATADDGVTTLAAARGIRGRAATLAGSAALRAMPTRSRRVIERVSPR
jgi:CelD/BcsL family acetyltransferase involved in cellulose biosynthesis